MAESLTVSSLTGNNNMEESVKEQITLDSEHMSTTTNDRETPINDDDTSKHLNDDSNQNMNYDSNKNVEVNDNNEIKHILTNYQVHEDIHDDANTISAEVEEMKENDVVGSHIENNHEDNQTTEQSVRDEDETMDQTDDNMEISFSRVGEGIGEELLDDAGEKADEETVDETYNMTPIRSQGVQLNPVRASRSSELMRIVTGRSSIVKTEYNDTPSDVVRNESHYDNNDENGYNLVKPVIVKSESLDDHYPADAFSQNLADTLGRTIINGCGIWTSWTRNFSSPLLALLDLFDNSLDAATMRGSQQLRDINFGRIHVDADTDLNQKKVTGIKIVNSSASPIKPLKEVFEVYGGNVDKFVTPSARIGENGVGLKQGCATLSDLSFCLVKNHGNQFSLGVLAWQLQTYQRFSLPSIQFKSTSIDELKIEMTQLFSDGKHDDIALCIRQYGGGSDEVGMRSLVSHFEAITNGVWESHDHVFTLILNGLKHVGEFQHQVDPDATGSQADKVVSLLQNLSDDLPKRYLHAPNRSELIVNVSGKPISFDYWRPRLVEMAQFDLLINETTQVVSDPDFQSFYFDENRPDRKDVYKLRVYTGFDILRACDEVDKTASMCIYSRSSGRLIKIISDCRAELGLANTGTKYCQGVTLIVDDIDGRIPLNPTKQDFAFGEQSSGETHKYNLYIWCNVALRCFYYYHLLLFDGKIALMMNALNNFEREARRLVQQSQQADNFKKIRDCQFTTFSSYASKIIHGKTTIRLNNKNDIIRTVGEDTLLQLPPEVMAAFASQSAASSSQLLEDGDEIGDSERAPNVVSSSNIMDKKQSSSDTIAKNGASPGRKANPKNSSELKTSSTKPSHDENGLHKKRKQSLDEGQSDEPKRRRTKTYLLELENQKLKMERKIERDKFAAELESRDERIQALEHKYKTAIRELRKQTDEVSTYKQKAKQHEKSYNSLLASSLTDRKTNAPGSTTTISNKKLRNLNSTIDLLKSENADLKEQVRNLRKIVQRKDQTITKQRTLIYQRDNEDSSSDDSSD